MKHRLLARHQPESEVAFGAAGVRTAADLMRDAATVAAALPRCGPAPHDEILMVFEADRYAFAATLLGAWSTGRAVTLPPNRQGETVTALLKERSIAALAHDTAVAGHLKVTELLNGQAAEPLSSVLLPEGVAAFALTSGSTKQHAVWPKTAQQLLGEAEVLAETFQLSEGQRFVPTIPPAHLYGLLFGVLLPLTCGGSFLRETPFQPQAVAERVQRFNAQVLVTVPLHLRAAQTIPPGGLRGVHTVFSSTAPLSGSTAKQFSQTHEIGITEVFGSTETGGIAWRRTTERELWRALPGVLLGTAAGGALTVDSPFLGAEVARPYVTADRVELHPNQSFSHRGRTDGVVKVGGRRVSLPSMEEWLLQRPGLQDCAVISAEQGERGARILAAIVAPDWTEQQQRALRGQMSEFFEPSTLPKRFLYLDRLPREENGKLPKYRVLEAFGLGANGQPLVREMLVRSWETDAAAGADATQIRAKVCVPENHLAFAGHFAGYAVLPGAAQLQHLVAEIALKHRPKLLAIRNLLHVKFTARIAPGDEVLVELRFPNSAPECDFTIRQGDIQCASGRVVFFEAPCEAASHMEEAPES